MIVQANKCFGKLSEGECFFLVNDDDKSLLMKTEAVLDGEYNYTLNTVYLCNGCLRSCNDDWEVIPIPARVSF